MSLVLYGSKNMIRFGDLFSVWSWFGFFEKKNLNSEWVWIGMSLIRILQLFTTHVIAE